MPTLTQISLPAVSLKVREKKRYLIDHHIFDPSDFTVFDLVVPESDQDGYLNMAVRAYEIRRQRRANN